MPPGPPDPPHRILIVRPSALGDVCRTVPVLASLREAFPEARIDWVVRDGYAAAIAAHPDLDEAIPFPRARFARWWRSPRVAAEVRGWLRDIGRRRYDLVLDCQGLGRSGLITRATRAPRRLGPSNAREFAWVGYTERVDVAHRCHTVDRMLALVEAAGAPARPDLSLHVPGTDRDWWSDRRARETDHGSAYAVLAPTARWASKRWPIERWIELLPVLRERGHERAVVIGAPGEEDQVRPLANQTGVIDLVGQTTVGQTMAVVASAGVVVANDSAPLHMAVGFDRPLVALFGPTDPAAVGPYGCDDWVVRAPPPAGSSVNYRAASTGDELMRAITVGAVTERLAAALAVPRREEAVS